MTTISPRPLSSFGLLNSTNDDVKILVTYNGNTYLLRLGEIKALVTKAGIGLDQVDNTSDLDKPLSNAIIAALENRAPVSHTHSVTDIDGLSDIISDISFEGVYVSVLEW